MAREKPPEPPAEDIPAWFMTYSDVITLLMTFFILLLTFSTTEPDRFERIQKTIFAGGKGSGVIGAPIEGPENESFIQRVRPRAARMAMNGAEMPPYEHDPSTKSVGEGLKGLTDEEAKQDTMSTSQIDLEINKLIDAENHLTPKGAQLAAMMAKPLAKMPIHLSIQCSSEQNFEKATAFVIHLYQTEQIRP
ncbi:MAG: flagellar motor protein MotB, partial [Planctomycetota bacterium]